MNALAGEGGRWMKEGERAKGSGREVLMYESRADSAMFLHQSRGWSVRPSFAA